MPVTFYSEEDTIQLRTDPVLLFFKSVVAEGDTTLKPMKPNFTFPRPWWPWILAGLLLAAFLIWWYKFRKEPEEAESKPQIEIQPFNNPIKELEKNLLNIKKDSDIAETKTSSSFTVRSVMQYEPILKSFIKSLHWNPLPQSYFATWMLTA